MLANKQRGLISPIIILIVIFIISVGAGFVIKDNQNRQSISRPNLISTVTASPSASIAPSATPQAIKLMITKTPTIIKASPTIVSTSTTSPVPNTNSTPANPYDLSAPSGAIEVRITANGGSVVGDQIVRLMTVSGFKVLDGRSSDHQDLIARQGSNQVNFTSMPPGPYKINIQYMGQWQDERSINVESAKQVSVVYVVTGAQFTTTPTPSPAPKASCQVNITSGASGPAPLTTEFHYGWFGFSPGGNIYTVAYQWDFNGDGSWDTTMDAGNGKMSYTYSTPGTYTVKLIIKDSTDFITDTCTNTVTVTPAT